jgi:hypothetical protein
MSRSRWRIMPTTCGYPLKPRRYGDQPAGASTLARLQYAVERYQHNSLLLMDMHQRTAEMGRRRVCLPALLDCEV